MNNQSTSDFLTSVHQKIMRKKRQKTIFKNAAFLIATVVISVQTTLFIQNDQIDSLQVSQKLLAQEIQINQKPDINSDQAFEYLIDELDFDELLEIFVDDQEDIELIQSINMEG